MTEATKALLEWRECMARIYEADTCDMSAFSERYRSGKYDDEFDPISVGYQAITRALEREEALTAEIERLRKTVAIARTLSDTLYAYGYPVSDTAWAKSSGSMSVQARALHLAASSLRAALAGEVKP